MHGNHCNYSALIPYSPMTTAPEVVTSVNLNFDDKNTEVTLTVSWSSPSSDVDIIHYKVQYWEDRLPGETLQINGLQTSISLVKERTYRLRVRAVSNIAEGPWSRTYIIGREFVQSIWMG